MVAALFGVSRFFAPLVAAIPAAAYAPALIIGGAMMIAPILKIDFDDYTELIPAFRVIALMSFTYNSEWESLPVSSCIHCSSWRRGDDAKYTPHFGCFVYYRYFFTSFTHINSYDSQNDISA